MNYDISEFSDEYYLNNLKLNYKTVWLFKNIVMLLRFQDEAEDF